MSRPRNTQVNAEAADDAPEWHRAKEWLRSHQRRMMAAQDSAPETVDLFCRVHPWKVGEARVDGVGNVFLLAKRRTGKGSRRAQQSGGRLVDQGTWVQVTWRFMAAASFDAQADRRNTAHHWSLIGGSLPDGLIGFYHCSEGHWVGTSDIDELLGWIDKALELRVHRLRLPSIAETELRRIRESVPAVVMPPMDPVNGTDRRPA